MDKIHICCNLISNLITNVATHIKHHTFGVVQMDGLYFHLYLHMHVV